MRSIPLHLKNCADNSINQYLYVFITSVIFEIFARAMFLLIESVVANEIK